MGVGTYPFRSICESLIQRKQLSPEIMRLFGNYQ